MCVVVGLSVGVVIFSVIIGCIIRCVTYRKRIGYTAIDE